LGPVLILAGAGSGKTRSLTMRIVYLIKKMRFKPEEILAVTFTNKAAGEMKERVARLLKKPGKISNFQFPISNMPTMGTFHSVGARILRSESRQVGLTPNFVIYDDGDQESLLKDILIKLKIDPTKLKPQMFAAIIDRAKNNLIEPDDPSAEALAEADDRFNDLAREVYGEYQLQLNKNNAADFGDLIMLPVKIFQAYPEVLKKYQDKWSYVLVDEYQDVNHAQYIFAKLLSVKHKNIFVVGDDAQAIYGFRGANMQNILDFEDDYHNAKVIRLEQNYRSTAPILAVAEKVIALSAAQHKKQLWTENTGGQLPTLYAASDEMAEAWFVAKKIIELQDENSPGAGAPPPLYQRGGKTALGQAGELSYEPEENSDEGILSRIMRNARAKILPKLKNRKGLNNIAVLYRTHAQSRALEEQLIEASIPYQIVGGLKFYERKEIKDVLSYMRLLINPFDLISLKRVINVPPRGIGPATFDILKNALLEERHPFGVGAARIGKRQTASDWVPLNANRKTMRAALPNNDKLQSFFQMLESIANTPEEASLLDVMRLVLRQTGYEAFLRDGTEEGETRFENVQELFNVAGAFSKFPWREGLGNFLEEIALMTSVDEHDPTSDKVTLMTLHQAKGLEFDTVFLIGLEEGLLPHARSLMEKKDISEEIRLAYVGITRAKQKLFLVYAQSRKQYGLRNMSVKSRILKAIPEELLDIYEPE